MRKGRGPKKARPMVDVLLVCDHWQKYGYVPERHERCWCVRCDALQFVKEYAMFLVMCDQCEFSGSHGSGIKITKQAEKHAIDNRHCTRVLRSDLELVIYNHVPTDCVLPTQLVLESTD
jgi:hypothetical protein